MGKGLEEASSTAAELSDSLLQAATIWEHPEAPGIAPPPPHPLIPLTHPHTPSHTLTHPHTPLLPLAHPHCRLRPAYCRPRPI